MKPKYRDIALHIIYGQDFAALAELLEKLDAYANLTCDYCGLRLAEHSDKRIAARSCNEED